VSRVVAVLALAVAFAAPGAPAARESPPRAQAYFTPGDDVARVIAGRIAAARESVQVQAYLFTDRRLAGALARAARRGVAVEVIGDARQHEAGGLPVLRALDRAGVRVWLAGQFAAFHNKVVVVDAQAASPVVITGSFNFTRAAQEKNAENIVVIEGDRALAGRYAAQFARLRALASRLQ
jgi:phosphatidylserine/phosphatidylglycerophosphate/cardiolipin synthase-like enzyme